MDSNLQGDLSMEYIPVDLMYKWRNVRGRGGVVDVRLKVWCAVYDETTGKLKAGFGAVPRGKSSDYLNGMTIPHFKAVRIYTNDPGIEHDFRTREKVKEGFRVAEGRWFIQPDAGKLFDLKSASDEVVQNISIRHVGMNGFQMSTPGDQPSVSDSAPRRTRSDLTRRLQGVSPLGEDWFF